MHQIWLNAPFHKCITIYSNVHVPLLNIVFHHLSTYIMKQSTVALKQHRFELHGPLICRVFSINTVKYYKYIFSSYDSLDNIFFSLAFFYYKNTVYNKYNIQNIC